MAQLSVKKLAFIALAFAVVTAALIGTYVSRKTNVSVNSEKTETVIVAKVDISPRTEIKAEMVEEVQLPESAIQPNTIRDLKSVLGVMTRETINKGEHITERRLFIEGKMAGFSGLIPKDKRAVTVSATAVTGVANFVKAGDFVDVYATFDGKEIGHAATSIVLQNLLVLAVNKDTDEEGKDHKQKDVPKTFTVTLAVTPEAASRLVLADEKGKIRLALRPFLPENDSIPTTISPRDLVDARQQVNSEGAVTVQGPTTNVERAPVHEEQPAPSGVMIMRGTKMSIAPVS